MEAETNYFTELASIDYEGHVEKKGEFAVWEVKRFDGKPYMQTDCGYFVEVAVSVNGITLSQIHPVLDNRNRPITEPNAFQINTSIQRCLVKAIALHGLGLYIYAGEDLPNGVEPDKISEQQYLELNDLMTATNTDRKKFAEYFKVTVPSDLPASEFERAKAVLEKKAAKTKSGTISQEQQEKILALVNEINGNLDNTLKYFKVKRLEDLPVADYPRIIQTIAAAKKAVPTYDAGTPKRFENADPIIDENLS
jgi:hypothetical protein